MCKSTTQGVGKLHKNLCKFYSLFVFQEVFCLTVFLDIFFHLTYFSPNNKQGETCLVFFPKYILFFIRFENLTQLAFLLYFFCLLPSLSPFVAAIMNLFPRSSAGAQLHGTFRQTEAMLFGQCFPLNGLSFIFTHGAALVPEQLYTWLHLELKEQAESLSPAKEQRHWESYWADCLFYLCFHSLSKQREYYFTLIKWPGFRKGNLTCTSISILRFLQNFLTNSAKIILYNSVWWV